jgi:thiol-disulfide isomerase/thioredoxin
MSGLRRKFMEKQGAPSPCSLDGPAVALSQFKGLVVLVTFWATSCLPCTEELPVLDRLYWEHESRGLTVLGINVREGADPVRLFSRALRKSGSGLTIRQYGSVT